MIEIKSDREIDFMRHAGEIAGTALKLAGRKVGPGITTKRLDDEIRRYILSRNAKPSFLGYNGFPASACISVNKEVIHGIPGRYKLKEGDIVSIDVGACYEGYHGDTAATFAVGEVSGDAAALVRVTRECFYKGLAAAQEGLRVSDISKAVHRHAENHGYGVVREYTGHGVGKLLHEDPQVPHYDTGRPGPRLLRGMTICIEPMINMGTANINILRDRWTVVTADGKLSAHYEHTVLVTATEPELLTYVGEDDGYGA